MFLTSSRTESIKLLGDPKDSSNSTGSLAMSGDLRLVPSLDCTRALKVRSVLVSNKGTSERINILNTRSAIICRTQDFKLCMCQNVKLSTKDAMSFFFDYCMIVCYTCEVMCSDPSKKPSPRYCFDILR